MPKPAINGSAMNADSEAESTDDIAVSVLADRPSSGLGQIVVSRAAQAMLARLNLQSSFLLGWHKMSEGDAIDLLGQKVLQPECSPVVTAYDTEFGPVEVVTELVTEAGQNRIRTRMFLPGEQP
ncbi:MAG: hypothetical protein CO065_15345 [Comamonadaceae bacterium CG_4_9_14_0_8_um_filter_57_21]|nr:MAG: hypothetical protein COY49_10705 [Comamonadaceae bacterium CG_4_10_14_0_8_um_filter_57_29]PJC13944.1 MAG: hypothetical protein CO065_15345 [Comamonadaceae bacterium CG_4_9_14_0_8_um_filter_57_21]